MISRLGLRVRIFLLFALLAGAIIAAVAGGLLLGYRYADVPAAGNGFIAAAVVSTFAILGLTVCVWLLFDENVAKPIQRLAAQLRARTHADAGHSDELEARYLGDLGPAARAVAERLGGEAAGALDQATARLQTEHEWLTALLSEIPVAVVLVSANDRIALYDAQAGALLSRLAPPRLGAPITDYIDRKRLAAARAEAATTAGEAAFDAVDTNGEPCLGVRLRPLSRGLGEMLLLESTAPAPSATSARPLVFDFELLDRQNEGSVTDRPLPDLDFVVLDTETTGLEPERDELVQIAAVRMVNGRSVAGEAMETLVNPGRSIPPQSSRVHGITDEQVADAPRVAEAVGRLHDFARDAVLVAHNAPFDLAFLKRREAEIGARFDHPVLDTVLLSAVVFGPHEAHNLDALCARLGIDIPDERRHTAPGDAEVTAAALCAMIPMLQARGFMTLREVLQQTRRHGRLLQDLNP